MSELWGCVVVAQLAAQAAVRARPEIAGHPVVVMQGVRPTERVCSLNHRARVMGLCEGMTRVEVETYEEVTVVAQSATEEAAAQKILVAVMDGFSPRIETKVCGADWECLVDLAGTKRLLGDSFRVGCQIVERLDQIGFAGFCCVAPNADAGLSVARFGSWWPEDSWCPEEIVRGETNSLEVPATRVGSRTRVMESGSEGWALAGLPVGVLRLADEMRERFAVWGIRTLGELAALPETALIVRIGQAGNTLRLRARGELPYFLQPIKEEFRLEETRVLEEPVETLEPLLALIDSLLELLNKRVSERALALASVTVALTLEVPADRVLGMEESMLPEGAPGRLNLPGLAPPTAIVPSVRLDTVDAAAEEFTRTVRPAVATVDRALLMKMLQLDLEAHPAPGAVVRLRVMAETGHASRIQLGLFAPQMPEPTRFEDTYARLVSVVGESNVGKVRMLDTNAPETFVLERFVLPSAEYKASVPRSSGTMPATALRRLRPGVQVRVSVKGCEIFGFWLDGRRFEVMRCYGPWRSSGAWWTGSGWSEDTWDLATRCEADGEVMICLLGHDLLRDSWVLEGVYD